MNAYNTGKLLNYMNRLEMKLSSYADRETIFTYDCSSNIKDPNEIFLLNK